MLTTLNLSQTEFPYPHISQTTHLLLAATVPELQNARHLPPIQDMHVAMTAVFARSLF